jgi:dolichol-phosphate mannosyltransferase
LGNSVVVIPTYNEAENIPKLIEQIIRLNINIRVLVVDDASPDGTGDIVEQLKNKYPEKITCIHRNGKLGFASAYIEGFKKALTIPGIRYIFSMDADLSHNPNVLPKFINLLDKYDVVVGSRYVGGTVSVVNWPIRRLILSRIANLYAQAITGLKIADCTSGFVGYRKEVLENINLDNIVADGYAFLIELKYRVQKAGYTITELPIIFEERRLGQSKISKRIIFEALFIVWRLRLGL